MRRNSRVMLLTLIVGLMLILMAACSSSNTGATPGNTTNASNSSSTTNDADSNTSGGEMTYATQDYSFSSGQPNGVMYPTAVSITNLMKKYTKWDANMNIFPGGGISNAMNVQDGKAQFGVSYSSAVASALVGEEPFGKPHDNIVNMSSLFPFYAQWVTLPDSDIENIEDLKGKKVNLGTKGQASRLVAEAIFEVYGMSESDLASAENLGFSDAVQQLKDGQLDAIFWQQNAPYAAFQELATTVGMKLIPIDSDKLDDLQKNNPGMIPSVIKAGTYTGIDVDIPTIETPISIVVDKELPEELIYDTVKAFHEHFEEFKQSLPALNDMVGPEDFAKYIGIDFHPGAQKYYEEAGWMK